MLAESRVVYVGHRTMQQIVILKNLLCRLVMALEEIQTGIGDIRNIKEDAALYSDTMVELGIYLKTLNSYKSRLSEALGDIGLTTFPMILEGAGCSLSRFASYVSQRSQIFSMKF